MANEEVFGQRIEWPRYVSSSSRSWWTCRLRAALSTGARLYRRGSANKHLAVGTMIHEVLAQHYNTPIDERGLERLLGWAEAASYLDEWSDELRADALEVAKRALKRFHARFGDDRIVPMGTEMVLEIPLPKEGDSYYGILDMVYEEEVGLDQPIIVVEDYKTSMTSIDPTTYTLRNPQAIDYLWAARQRWPDRLIMLRYLFVTPTNVRRMDLSLDMQTDHIEEQLQALAEERRTLPITANYGYHCKDCQYRLICATHLMGGDVEGLIKAEFIGRQAQAVEESEEGE